jgi:hypothetical protein
MFTIRLIKRAVEQLFCGLRSEFARRKASDHGAVPTSFPVSADYIVSTDGGLFCVSHNSIRHLTSVPAFGVAIDGEDVFIATWRRNHTAILKGRAAALRQPGSFSWREIYSQPVASSAGRIHQIGVYGGALWLANTGRNCLTKLDRHDGAWRANIAPLACAFGGPILGDNNHINGVMPGPDYVLFSVFKIHRRAAFGICGRGRIALFAYANIGIHDCIVAGGELWFSDSYRFWEKKGGGVIVRDGNILGGNWFDANPQGFVRGISGDADEVIVGSSFFGTRDRRFSGRGRLILVQDEFTAFTTLELAASQVYDIVRLDGRRLAADPPKDFDEAFGALRRALGDPLVEYPLCDFLVSKTGPKFDHRDIGAIGELLGG